MTTSSRPCNITFAGRNRNGRPRYWCSVHSCTAKVANDQDVPTQCTDWQKPTWTEDKCFELKVSEYPGGVAVWGAVSPVYDTTNLGVDDGVHVHARMTPDGGKVIDQTFPAVAIEYNSDLLTRSRVIITQSTAVNYFITKFLGLELKYLFCIHCGGLHLDAGAFAVSPHRKHLCNHCGRNFFDTSTGISNPIEYVKKLWGVENLPPNLIPAHREGDFQQADYPGGIRIWASNPAVLWTAARPEEEGIHVHLYKERGWSATEDDTFKSLHIDGEYIDPLMVRYLMAQKAVPEIADKVVDLSCPHCGNMHFDQGFMAFKPHGEHECEKCDETFVSPSRLKYVVSNPLVGTLRKLQANLHPTSVEETGVR